MRLNVGKIDNSWHNWSSKSIFQPSPSDPHTLCQCGMVLVTDPSRLIRHSFNSTSGDFTFCILSRLIRHIRHRVFIYFALDIRLIRHRHKGKSEDNAILCSAYEIVQLFVQNVSMAAKQSGKTIVRFHHTLRNWSYRKSLKFPWPQGATEILHTNLVGRLKMYCKCLRNLFSFNSTPGFQISFIAH